MPPLGQFIFYWLVLAVIHIRTKLEVSVFTCFREGWPGGVPNFKSGLCDPSCAPSRAVHLLFASTC